MESLEGLVEDGRKEKKVGKLLEVNRLLLLLLSTMNQRELGLQRWLTVPGSLAVALDEAGKDEVNKDRNKENFKALRLYNMIFDGSGRNCEKMDEVLTQEVLEAIAKAKTKNLCRTVVLVLNERDSEKE